MENRKGGSRIAHAAGFPLFPFPFSLFLLSAVLALSACGTPGDPTPPRPVVPVAITDLAARQSGGRVVLTFTLPTKNTDDAPLAEPPALEIYRTFLPVGTAPPPDLRAELVYTVPSAVVETYVTEGRVKFEDPLKADDVAQHAKEQWVYAVRSRASKRANSASSDVVALRVYPVPLAVGEVTASVTETAVELRWAPPTRAAGITAAEIVSYRVYRAEVETGEETRAAADPAKAKLAAPPALLAVTPSPGYRDTQFEFGHAYFYTVRSVAQFEADSVESPDSRPAVVVPRDTFPPAAPLNLVAILTPATAEASAQIELSWGISPETDLAGYHVYRSEEPGAHGQRLTRGLLPAPAFRDISVLQGHRYTYTVTAVDRTGNESPHSAPVTEAVSPRPD